MPYQKILLQPGINTLATQTLNSSSWSSANLIRWLNGYLQKIGGWVKLINEALIGTARSMHAFLDLDGNAYMAIGTNAELALVFSGSIYNITPIIATNDLTAPLSTTISTGTVNVNDIGNGTSVGDYVGFVMPTAIGGLLLFGDYAVTEIIDANNYHIESGQSATATVSGGGSVPQFVTVMGDATVTVNLDNHGQTPGSIFTVQISTMVGGFTLLGDYVVDTVPTADSFTIEMPTTAGSNDTQSENGGDVRIVYYLPTGPVSDTALIGYGSGGYGMGPYGGPSSGGTAVNPARIWSLDNFGENLVAVPNNGSLYEWIPPVDTGNNATLVATAPTINTAMFVAMPQAQVVLLGSETGSVQDQLLVRWCDNGDYTVWTATSTNEAGSYRLSKGSKIIGGIQAPQNGLIWTDIDLWGMTFEGYPFVYGFQEILAGCGMVGIKARGILGRTTYWMSQKGFFQFGDGGAQAIPCAVWDQVFADLDTDNVDKVIGAPNSLFNEITFFYPTTSAGTGEISAYAKFTPATGLWDIGALVRTAWIDQSLFGPPMGVDENRFIQQHETGYNNDNVAMEDVSATSGYADIAQGQLYMFVDHIIPDIYMTGGNPSVTLTVFATNWPGGPVTTFGPYTVTPSTEYITIRTRARQLAFKIESDSLDTFWRIGAIRYRGAPNGRVG